MAVINMTPDVPKVQKIGREQLLEFTRTLQQYKAGKSHLERRVVSSEQWWKLRNDSEERHGENTNYGSGFKSRSGWLHNVIVSKHADGMEAYPEANLLPREEADKAEAAMLSSIIPCILEQNDFEQTYSDVLWQKLKTGTGVYKIMWDQGKLGGLGDISISKVSLLNLYWEPGVEDIQDSAFVFHTELADKAMLKQMYPQLTDKLTGTSFVSTKFLYDDTVNTDDKATVIEVYYHGYAQGGKKILHYCKFVDDTVLYATENEVTPPTQNVLMRDENNAPVIGEDGQPMMAETPVGEAAAVRGLYDHGLYPFVFDALFPIEGYPNCGYGFVDLCKNPQTSIDLLNTAFIKNAMVGATPRYFGRTDGGVNEKEFLDLTKPIVHVNGNLGEDSLRQIDSAPLQGVYVSVMENTVQELRETSGNTESAQGIASSGVTAASAIAALQEASGKGSRDSTKASYRAFTKIVNMCVELIRQFYDMPRQFRIVGQMGMQKFVSYSNAGLQPQYQGNDFGVDLGFRTPVFDIKISAQKKNVYTKVSQNELALQFFQLGFFNPQLTDQALACLEMMDFDQKDDISQRIAANGTMMDQLLQWQQMALTLAQKYEPAMADGLAQSILQGAGQPVPSAAPAEDLTQMPAQEGAQEITRVQNARRQSQEASQPDGGGEK
ncbi:MAG: hypothetical protein IKZ82_06345 [Clostridia bacterium]|nr:hypothetical protein [Clostridia bacterium]